ncbi:DNA ligase [Pasteurella sp. PK-2025]|uniref:DNA ligase n=1 Tax=Pasteurella sp. PK-2025 TaxID=3413133 RepID=UPI003C771175
MRFIIFILMSLFLHPLWAKSPELMLVESYKNQHIEGWVMSEKLDGIRGYWDGKTLYSRQGFILTPPQYFIAHFPPFAIDGELFSQRNQFENISSIVRSQQDKGWHQLKLHVFDVPDAKGNLFERLATLKAYLAKNPTPYIQIIEQIPIQNKAHIAQFLKHVEQQQGEGIILRNPHAPYERKRSQQILKLKSTGHDECRVIAHHQGKGQFEQHFGALTCENQHGQFKIGSGFTLADRLNPPKIGSKIRYKYRGFTKYGKPKFATYWQTSTPPAPEKNPNSQK